MDPTTWILAGLAFAALALTALLMGPLFFGRMFLPRQTLYLFKKLGGGFAKVLNRFSPGLDLRLLVKAGNRYFRNDFKETPLDRRLIFLPFCLKPPDCPAPVDPAIGVCCRDQYCPGCQIGDIRREALAMGYQEVYLVPSSRILKGRGLKPSAEFIRGKLIELGPGAALGVVCGWHLRNRLLPRFKVGKKGVAPGSNGARTVVQGVLLEKRNCRAARVDWDKVRGIMAQMPGRPEG